jgi:polyisoprenoid-binding protein YceI
MLGFIKEDTSVKVTTRILALAASLAVFGMSTLSTHAQNPPPAPQRGAPPPGPTPSPNGFRLDLIDGSRATYRVQEQLAGINFPNDASGSTNAVTGTIQIGPDGTINSAQSKLTVDLRTLKSDQDLRDNYLRTRVFDTEKFPMIEFVPRRLQGLTYPFPSGAGAQAGFQLVGDMTIKGVTKEVAWTVVATFVGDNVAGRAKTTLDFATFNLTKPTLARLLSVNDKIDLEVELRAKRTPL